MQEKNVKTTQKISVVIPAYNEEKFITHVIKESLTGREVSEVIVVNDGSTDKTEFKIQQFLKNPKFVYIKHKANKGKGEALKTGFEHTKNDIILFLDADLKNISTQKIRKIYLPVLKGEVDVSRGAFSKRVRRVTEFTVKPMMKILFPDLYFDEPISGQICAKKDFLSTIKLESKYGVDIGLLFDAIQQGQRIMEVNIGKLETKLSDQETLTEMARQVLETMIKKAGLINHKYKLVVFTLDNTLISSGALDTVFKKLGLYGEFNKIRKQNLEFGDFATKVAKLFEGVEIGRVEEICKDLPLTNYALEVVNFLKRRKYQIAIISSNFSPIALAIAKRLGVESVDCVYLESLKGKLNGDISAKSKEKWLVNDLESSFQKAFLRVAQRAKVKPLETIIVAHSHKSVPLFSKAGLSIAFKTESRSLKEFADKTISVLPEILAIIE